ncbi:MAG: hypothetical protein KKH06_01545, partial [Gammaproteobacteria bacterium]|nr:hypothetical protein [Gammaproteobacteria bacterium]
SLFNIKKSYLGGYMKKSFLTLLLLFSFIPLSCFALQNGLNTNFQPVWWYLGKTAYVDPTFQYDFNLRPGAIGNVEITNNGYSLGTLQYFNMVMIEYPDATAGFTHGLTLNCNATVSFQVAGKGVIKIYPAMSEQYSGGNIELDVANQNSL